MDQRIRPSNNHIRTADPLHSSDMAWSEHTIFSKNKQTFRHLQSSQNDGNRTNTGRNSGKDAPKEDSDAAQPPQSLPSILQAFAADSTIHGISKATSPNIYTGRRLFWTLLVLAGSSSLVTFTVMEVQKFLTYDTITTESSTDAFDLPAITLCPLKAFDGTATDFVGKASSLLGSAGGGSGGSSIPNAGGIAFNLGGPASSVTLAPASAVPPATAVPVVAALSGTPAPTLASALNLPVTAPAANLPVTAPAANLPVTTPAVLSGLGPSAGLPLTGIDPTNPLGGVSNLTSSLNNLTTTLNDPSSIIDSITGLLNLEDVILTRLRYPPSHLAQTSLLTAHLGLFGWATDNLPAAYTDPNSGELLKNWTLNSNVMKLTNCPHQDGALYKMSCCPSVFKETLTEIGKCTTFDPQSLTEDNAFSRQVKQERRLLISLALSQPLDFLLMNLGGLQFIVHEPGEMPLPNLRGIFLPGESMSSVVVKRTKKVALAKPFTPFDSGDCTETDSDHFENPLRRFSGDYKTESCKTECMINYTVNACGCRHPWHPQLIGEDESERVCTMAEVFNCSLTSQLLFSQTTESLLNCSCPTPCQTVDYEINAVPEKGPAITFKGLNFDSVSVNPDVSCHQIAQALTDVEKLMVIDVKLPHESNEVKQVQTVTVIQLLASIGGLIGLIMGVSVLSLVELVELVFLMFQYGVSKAKCRRSA